MSSTTNINSNSPKFITHNSPKTPKNKNTNQKQNSTKISSTISTN